MKHPRTTITIVAATALVAVVAAIAAASSGGAHGAAAKASRPSGATTTSVSGGASAGTTGVAGTLRLVNPGGPMIAAGGSPPPAPAVIVELLSPTTHAVVARGRVAGDGSFSVPAPPGIYVVGVAPAAGGASVTVSHRIVVTADGFAHLASGPVRGL